MVLVWFCSLAALGRAVWALRETQRNEREALRRLEDLKERMARDRAAYREEIAA